MRIAAISQCQGKPVPVQRDGATDVTACYCPCCLPPPLPTHKTGLTGQCTVTFLDIWQSVGLKAFSASQEDYIFIQVQLSPAFDGQSCGLVSIFSHPCSLLISPTVCVQMPTVPRSMEWMNSYQPTPVTLTTCHFLSWCSD